MLVATRRCFNFSIIGLPFLILDILDSTRFIFIIYWDVLLKENVLSVPYPFHPYGSFVLLSFRHGKGAESNSCPCSWHG